MAGTSHSILHICPPSIAEISPLSFSLLLAKKTKTFRCRYTTVIERELSCLLQLLLKSEPKTIIDHASKAKRRNNATHARQRALQPIHSHFPHAIRHGRVAVAIVQVQAEEMERCAEELNSCRSQKLRCRSSADVFLCGLGQRKVGSDQGWKIEAREDGERVS